MKLRIKRKLWGSKIGPFDYVLAAGVTLGPIVYFFTIIYLGSR